jgi:Flp pilus assembly secretin CpaC
MFKTLRSLLLLLSLFPLVQTAISQETDFNPLGRIVPIEELPTLVRIQVEWIELPHLKMSELLNEESQRKGPGGLLSTNGEPLRKKLEALIVKGEARVIETSIVSARSGQKATIESISEHIYPTEYEPGGMVMVPAGKDEKAKEISKLPLATAFETKNLGVTIEIEPTIGEDAQLIDLRILPELVYLIGSSKYGSHKEGESEVTVEMPTFYKLAINTSVTLLNGQQLFLAAQTPVNLETGKPHPDLRAMVFVKADVCYVGLETEDEEAE